MDSASNNSNTHTGSPVINRIHILPGGIVQMQSRAVVRRRKTRRRRQSNKVLGCYYKCPHRDDADFVDKE